MRKTADVAIVGAGIMGLSIAYQIARRSSMQVVVLEKAAGPAEGSTGASSAMLRQRYSNRNLVRLARGGLLAYRSWGEFTRLVEPRASFRHSGVLWMMGGTRSEVDADCDRLRVEGVDAVVLDADDLSTRFPAFSACPHDFEEDHGCLQEGAFLLEQDGGYFEPVSAAQDLVDAARREGVEIHFRTEVTGLGIESGVLCRVELADGSSIGVGSVINAAGPWCNRLTGMTGLDLGWDLVPTRVQVGYRSWPEEVTGPIPVTGDAASGIYFRPEAANQQLLFGSIREQDEREAVDPDSYRGAADRSFLDERIHGLHHRLPGLPHRGIVTGIAGLYTVNRDDVHPVVGPTALDGFVVANGFSGHGFKLAPMVGAILARWLTGESSDYDTDVPMEFLSPDRQPIDLVTKSVLA